MPSFFKIRVNSVNPTVVMTTMGRAAWSAPGVADNILKRIPNGRFAGTVIPNNIKYFSPTFVLRSTLF
jgi:NAD(P)-dependent dehydrogenase (short-subunit alcohol dehydrogenase family)